MSRHAQLRLTLLAGLPDRQAAERRVAECAAAAQRAVVYAAKCSAAVGLPYDPGVNVGINLQGLRGLSPVYSLPGQEFLYAGTILKAQHMAVLAFQVRVLSAGCTMLYPPGHCRFVKPAAVATALQIWHELNLKSRASCRHKLRSWSARQMLCVGHCTSVVHMRRPRQHSWLPSLSHPPLCLCRCLMSTHSTLQDRPCLW